MDIYTELALSVKQHPRKIGEFTQAFINVIRQGKIYFKVVSDGYNRSFVSYRDIATNAESTICANELEKEIIETIIKNL